jgi:L-ascorbate metabolism protein UlaG (beta-lactamase superfamily)
LDVVTREDVDFSVLLDSRRAAGRCLLSWLGQAGFLIRSDQFVLVIDAYLSDSLAEKYRGTEFSHTRLMPVPIMPEGLAPVDAVFCTHAHTDHMDPETVAVLADRNPRARFFVPKAARETAGLRGIPSDRTIAMNSGDRVRAAPGLEVHALASAHEELRTDAAGHHHFLGYVIKLGDLVIYHSGDCVPYPGLAARLAAFEIDLAILPVNGRDDHRRRNGVPGNFTLPEAAALCVESGISSMIACHFGMFAFNTLSETCLDRQIADLADLPQCIRPRVGRVYELGGRPLSSRRDSLFAKRNPL